MIEWTDARLLVSSRTSLSGHDVMTDDTRPSTCLLTITAMTGARWPLRPDWPLTSGRRRVNWIVQQYRHARNVYWSKKSKVVDLYSASSWHHFWCATVSRKSALISASQPDSHLLDKAVNQIYVASKVANDAQHVNKSFYRASAQQRWRAILI